MPDGLSLTRAGLCDPPPARPDGSILFALHTVDLRDHESYPIKAEDFESLAREEHSVRRKMMERDRKRAALEEAHAEIHVGERWAPDPEPMPTTVYITGQLPGGRKIGIVTKFRPSCQVELPDGHDTHWFKRFIPLLAGRLRVEPKHLRVQFHRSVRFKGYVPESVENPRQRKRFLFAQLSFPNIELMKKGASKLRYGLPDPRTRFEVVFRVYEDRIDADQKFVDYFSLSPSGWHVLSGPVLQRTGSSPGRELLVDYEYEGRASKIKALEVPDLISDHEPAEVQTLSIASLDCEMNPHLANRFPKSWRETDAIIVVGVVFAMAGNLPSKLKDTDEYVEYERRAYVLSDKCDPIPGVIVELFDDENELIAAVRDELFVRKKIDVLVGHNHTKFDIKYMAERIINFGFGNARRFMRFGTLLMESLSLVKKPLNSAALGSNMLYLLNGVGFVYVDTLLLCKQYQKLRQNSLKFASSVFLKEVDPSDPTGRRLIAMNKFDMPYELIPDAARGSGLDWKKLTAYCVQDCILPLRLIQRWDSVKDLVAQSRIINILMAVNVKCGQQQRVRNTLMKKAHRSGMVMNGVNEYVKDRVKVESAEGGWVLDNVQGLHDLPVVVLDFASLYPSMQRDGNLCWSTCDEGDILPEHEAAGLVVKEWKTATGTFRFVQNVPGVFPEQLTDLLNARKAYKGEMKRYEKGSSGYKNADNKQKATKIVMNSGYGTANAQNGIMPCLPVGTVTCYMGRIYNQRADAFCKEKYGTWTIYGDTDSIMVYFPEPDHIKSASRKVRLRYAMDMGIKAEKEMNTMFNSDVVKMECEKVYFPFLSSGKKTYAGLKFEPGDVDGCTDDLDRPNDEIGQGGGSVEFKGLRPVRRDVPLFCKRMAESLLDALFYDRNLDRFWDIVHTFAEDIVFNRLSLKDYSISQEIKEGYHKQDLVRPHVAVSYAREYETRGAAYEEGDRVSYVMVEEPDRRRVVRPAWMDLAPGSGPLNEDEEVKDARISKSGSKTLSGMFARLIEEVEADPDNNHIDIVYYMDKGICSVLKQLMPKEIAAQKELLAYAAQAQNLLRRERCKTKPGGLMSSFGFSVSSEPAVYDLSKGLPKLSHKAPVDRRGKVKTLDSFFGGKETVIEAPSGPARSGGTKRRKFAADGKRRVQMKLFE